jgi:predicted negative regulator of RcsB-dependent stress response
MELTAMMDIKTPRVRLARPKKHVVIIVVAVILVIALAVYGFLSYVSWRDLDQDSKRVSSSLKTAIDESLGAEKEAISPTTEMKTLISDFETKYSSTPCAVSPFMGWQTVVPQVKTITTECDERFSNALAVIASLKPLATFIEHEQAANDLLAASIKATKAPTNYSEASATWKAVAESTTLDNTGDFQPVADKITEVSTAISTAYTAIDKAMEDEDKAALDKAIKSLASAYKTISTIAALTTSERQALVVAIADAYDAL